MSNLFNRIKDILSKNYFSILILILLGFSFLLRFFKTKYGLPYIYNWDEPHTLSTALKILKTGDKESCKYISQTGPDEND